MNNKITNERITVVRPVSKQFEISSPFGIKRKLVIDGKETERIHYGIDFSVPEKMPVYAMLEGRIHKVGFENWDDQSQGFGYRIIQECSLSGLDLFLWYAHLAWSIVHENLWVKQGEVIAMSGNTGRSSNPHLHIQGRIKDTGNYVDFNFKEAV